MNADRKGPRKRELRSDVRADLASMKAEILKWSFAFWLAQLATIAALVLRLT